MQTILVDAFAWGMFIGLAVFGTVCAVIGTVWTWRYLEKRRVRKWLIVLAMIPTWIVFDIGGWLVIAGMLAVKAVNCVVRPQLNSA